MALPSIPKSASGWLNSSEAQQSLAKIPPNLAASMPEDTQCKLVRFINTNYAWPQILERFNYEPMWNALLDMYRINLSKVDSNLTEDSPAGKDQIENQAGDSLKVADSVFHDAVERLTDITHFISFKENLPVQFNIPAWYNKDIQTPLYQPISNLIQAANALLAWNAENENVYRNHFVLSRHHYTYGISFALSEFIFQTEEILQDDLSYKTELTKIGTGFEPINIRKLWLNYRLPVNFMEYQPCPFLYDEMPRTALLANQYDPRTNPFGYVNLASLQKDDNQTWLFTETELQSQRQALEKLLKDAPHSTSPLQYADGSNASGTIPQLLDPKYSVEARWKYYPMLPLDPQTLDFETYPDGTPVPSRRFIVEMFGANSWGNQILLRVQQNFYPQNELPLFGSTHLPDLDSGLYCPSIGYILWNHYKEICTCMNQFIANKDWINNPPSWVSTGSPAQNQNLTKPGAKIIVNGPNDFGWRTPYDGTQSTVAMLQMLRNEAQQTSKSTDALLGKAMGGRTSATEASNAFQAAMSAVTTPINIYNYDMMGGFASRVWGNASKFLSNDFLKQITGQLGFQLRDEDLAYRFTMKWDVGSSYVESIVRQQHYQYALQTSIGDPTINRAELWRFLLEEWGVKNVDEIVNDGGATREIYLINQQIIKTLETGQMQPVNPDQNHQLAQDCITQYLEDQDSVWHEKFGQNMPLLVQLAQIHQQFAMLQMHQQILMQRANEPDPNPSLSETPPAPTPGQPQAPNPPAVASTPGQAAQQNQ